MSFTIVDWATHAAPVANTYERIILMILADRASADGSGAYRSKRTLAEAAICNQKTVQNHLGKLRERGLIGYGDQALVSHIPKGRQPVVYDVLMPFSQYPSWALEQANKERAEKGAAPLSPELRPELPAPQDEVKRRPRSDKGKPNPKRRKKPVTSGDEQGGNQGGIAFSPVDEPSEPASEDDQGGIAFSPGEESHSPQEGMAYPQTCPENPSGENLSLEPFGDTQKVPDLQKVYGETAGHSAYGETQQGELASNHLHARARSKAGPAACQALNDHPAITQPELADVIRQETPGLSEGQASGRAATLLTFERKDTGSGHSGAAHTA